MKKSNTVIGLYVPPFKEDGSGFTIAIYPVILGSTVAERADFDRDELASMPPADRVRNISDRAHGDTNGLFLKDFMIGAHGDTSGAIKLDHVYGWHAEYRNVYSVDASAARAMAKTLDVVAKRLGKLNDKYGYVPKDDFAGYVLRVADAIGATKLVFPKSGSGWSYDDTKHDVHDMLMGGWKIRKLIEDKLPKPVAAGDAS